MDGARSNNDCSQERMTELPNVPKDPAAVAWVLTHERSIVDGRESKPTLLSNDAKQVRGRQFS